MERQIHDNDPFHQWLSSAQVDNGTNSRRGREAPPHDDLMGAKGPAASIYASASAGTGGVRDDDFDRLAWFDVQSMQPSRGVAGESRTRG
jgi:hypothetical protein